jgi:hypothetical protein
MSLASNDRATARKKGLIAAGATAGAVALVAVAPVLAALAVVPSAFLVRDWFMFRARRGMRF